MMTHIRFLKRCLGIGGVLLSTFVLLGCGGGVSDAPEDLVEVTGTLKQGDKPIGSALLLFTPEGAAAPSTATSGADGTFSLTYSDGRSGAVPGSHRVSITVGSMPMATADGGDTPPAAAPPEPKEYFLNTNVDEEPLTLEIDLNSL